MCKTRKAIYGQYLGYQYLNGNFEKIEKIVSRSSLKSISCARNFDKTHFFIRPLSYEIRKGNT